MELHYIDKHDIEVTSALISSKTRPVSPDYDRSRLTRLSCIAALGLSWIIAFVCFVTGVSLLSRAAIGNDASGSARLGWLGVDMGTRTKQFVPLLINIVITLLTEGLGLIHSTTLRWALGERLSFNSNLRLFTVAKGYWGAFGCVSNFFNAGFLALVYCAPSVLFAEVPAPWICDVIQDKMEDATHDYVGSGCVEPGKTFFSPSALLVLGIGLAGKSAISSWQLGCGVRVPTWSTSPVDTVWACVADGSRTRVSGRCMMNVHESTMASQAKQPSRRQRPAWSANGEIRRVLVYLWALVALLFVFFGIMLALVKKLAAPCADPESSGICGAYSGTSWNLLPDANGITSLLQIQTIATLHGGVPRTVNDVAVGMLLTFILLMAVQSFLTMGLHCTELLVTTVRDEHVWRETYSAKGYKSTNAIMTVLKSPMSLLLLALKPVVHWLYGLTLTYYYRWGVFIRPPQILYLAISLVGLAGFGTAICLVRPKGEQPVTFGHVQTLVDLIDEYGERMYWGEKEGVEDQGDEGMVAHAGTATKPLKKVQEGAWYAGGWKDKRE